jgi:tetratricopeptide (TPR) repeat protein/transposase-like protein
MDRCEICGRRPAKRMSFKAHQGFLVFRRETEISGMFCRDHALAAYAAARGITLTGMWFSPGALVFGTLRSLFDAAKLIDLPEEVRDEPWVPHKVGCPRCAAEHFATAGPSTCSRCGFRFVVASCASCGAVTTISTSEPPDHILVACRLCGRQTSGPASVRNWPALLIARSLAEAAAEVAIADGEATISERDLFDAAIKRFFKLEPATYDWLRAYFDRCAKGKSEDQLSACVSNCHPDFVRLLLSIAVLIAEADGSINEDEKSALIGLAARCGLNPDQVFGSQFSTADQTGDWCEVLGVPQTATSDEINVAYRRLARQFHPDLWHEMPEAQRNSAEARMKQINAAYGRARSASNKTEPRKASGRNPQPERADRPNPTQADFAAAAAAFASVKAQPWKTESGSSAAAESTEERPAEAPSEPPAETAAVLNRSPRHGRAAALRSTVACSLLFAVIFVLARRADRSDPDFLHDSSTRRIAEALFQQATVAAEAGDWPIALSRMNDAAALNPDLSRIYKPWGDSCRENGNLVLAVQFYSKAIELNVDALNARVARGLTFRRLRRLDEAIQDFKGAWTAGVATADLRDALTEAHVVRATSRLDVADETGAIEDLRYAVALDNQSAKSQALLALAYQQRAAQHILRDQYDQALEDLTRAKGIDNDATSLADLFSMAYAGRAEVLLSSGSYDEAIRDLTAAQAARPDQVGLKTRLAAAYSFRSTAHKRAHKFREAYADWARARQLDSTIPAFSTYP